MTSKTQFPAADQDIIDSLKPGFDQSEIMRFMETRGNIGYGAQGVLMEWHFKSCFQEIARLESEVLRLTKNETPVPVVAGEAAGRAVELVKEMASYDVDQYDLIPTEHYAEARQIAALLAPHHENERK